MKTKKKTKAKSKLKTIEDAIIAKFPNVTIHEMHHSKFGTRVLGVVPAIDEFDSDHIVEWGEDGLAKECPVTDRDYREVGWNEEEQKPVYIQAKLLIPRDEYNVSTDGTD